MQKQGRESKSSAIIRRRRLRGSPSPSAAAARSYTSKLLPQPQENLDSDDDDLDMSCLEHITGPPVLRLIMSSEHTLFLGLLAFRVVNALILQTSFVPDEYWQSMEVAHNMAFGYGYKTWEWRHGLRGYLYPLLFAIPYKILGVMHLDNRIFLIKLPRLIQGFFAALGDIYLYKLSTKLAGVRVGRWTLLCQVTSWFTFYCAPRTLTNSMETVLTTMAMYYFPWPGCSRKAQWKYVTLAGLAVVVRPTAAIVWIWMCLWHLLLYRHVGWKVLRLYAERGFMILSFSSVIDRIFYGKWEYVQLNFLQFNVLSNLSTFYGSHPWHWYLSQGFVVILGVQTFPFVLAVKKLIEPAILGVIAWTVFVYSCLGHKEFRFLFPILPLAMHLCGLYLCQLSDGTAAKTDYSSSDSDSDNPAVTSPPVHKHIPSRSPSSSTSWNKSHLLIFMLIAGNLPLALYTGLIHQRGTLDVMSFIHEETRSQSGNQSISVLALMPCHSIPHYSYLHQNISLRFLTCEPNLNQISNYLDEADIFYQDPGAWLNTTYHPAAAETSNEPPTHLVMFDVLRPRIPDFVDTYKYEECARFFHTHAPEGRVGSYVIVMCSRQWQMVRKSSHNSRHKGMKFTRNL